ncbi:P68 family surface lipoprotein [Mycoplasma sp. E35C]|uniref:P68 family surface lipoprotein n=1 Tax=Mycoplasma sp. E35C TaxID=2801918 RepID=UPI001CA44827|nr:P80 family lipoprotein [Mycoplasma sp. E35C]QZX49308.1 hypothetical protein JJE79_00955 [Mycoplasma sp. E35C]
MLKKTRKSFISSLMALGFAGTMVLSSCAHAGSPSRPIYGGDPDNKVGDTSGFGNKIVIQTAQNRFYPLMHALSSLVESYNNEFFKKDPTNNFEVVLQQSEETKAASETQLTSNVLTKIQAKSNDIPNILLADLNSAYQLQRVESLLDISGSQIINANYFDSTIFNEFNKIAGSDESVTTKVYAIPFNLTTVDSLVFNKPLMNLLFKFVKDGGGEVKEDSNIYKELKIESFNPESYESIKNKKWFNLEVKENNVFKGVTVDDSTFENLESMFDFAKKITEGLKVKSEKTVSGQQRDLKIFMLDYGPSTYKKYLWSKLGNTKESWLWNYKVEDGKNELDYTNLEKEQNQNIIKQSFKFFKDSYAKQDLSDDQWLKSIYFSQGGTNDWASWDIRTYDTAFAIAPHVGWNQSVISPFSINTFGKKANEALTEEDVTNVQKKFASQKDVLWKNQLTRYEKDQKERNTFLIGGSSLVGVKTSAERDKQTIKFLEWLFNDDTIIHDESSIYNNQSISKVLNSKSAYDITSKKALSKEALDKLNKEIEGQETKVNKFFEENSLYANIKDPDWSQIYLNKGAAASLKDWLDFKAKLEKEPSKNSIAFINNDSKSLTISAIINKAIFDITTKAGSNLSEEQLITNIKEQLARDI